MAKFTITGFADEISPDLDEQIRVLLANDIHHIEIRGIAGKNVSDFTLDEARQYHQKLVQSGIQVSSLGSPLGKIKITDDFTHQLDLFKHVLALADIFESPFIRAFSFYLDSDGDADRYQSEVIQRWRRFMNEAAAYPQITILHENEKEIFGDTPERCVTLLKAINSSQFRAAFDPANFVQCGVEVYPHAFELLLPYLAYVHIKDARFSDGEVTPAGFGDGRVKEVLSALVAQNYQGFLSLEPHLASFAGYEQLEHRSVSIQSHEQDGARTFTIASNALKEILVKQLDQQWQ